MGIQVLATPLHALVTIGWQDNADNETGFRVERSTDGMEFAAVATLAPDTTQFDDGTVAPGCRYWYRIVAFNAGGDSDEFAVVSGVTPGGLPNSAPTITALENCTVAPGQAPDVFTFSVGDAETAAGDLILIGNTSNSALVPPANLSFGGAGASRTLTVTPVANVTGWTTVWVKVSDGELTAVSSFVLVVAAPGTPQAPIGLLLSSQ